MKQNPITFAVAWSKQHEFVASTIIGARKLEQLDASLAALDIKLNNEIMKKISLIQREILYPMG